MVQESYGLPFKKSLAVCWRNVADDRRSPLSIEFYISKNLGDNLHVIVTEVHQFSTLYAHLKHILGGMNTHFQ